VPWPHPSQYKQRVERSEEQGDGVVREEDRFRVCERLVVQRACGDKLIIKSPVRGSGKDAIPSLLFCPRTKGCGGSPIQMEGKLINAMDMLVRQVANKNYADGLVRAPKVPESIRSLWHLYQGNYVQGVHRQPALHPAAVHHLPARHQEDA
jgi:hypothetical protein